MSQLFGAVVNETLIKSSVVSRDFFYRHVIPSCFDHLTIVQPFALEENEFNFAIKKEGFFAQGPERMCIFLE